MLENVSMVGVGVPTEDTADNDLILVSRKELDRLKREREEYRAMCLDFAESVPRFHEIADNIETILSSGGAGK